jgi:hypothetical protein
MPITAEPASDMTVFTSAKSTLMSPGVVMRSVMPVTPFMRTSSARRKVSSIGALGSPISSRRSLGITMSVSTASRRAWIPSSALTALRRPSKPNGRVTTPTVSAPRLRATSATTGAPPVPVPPPSPQVMNTMSAPFRASSSSWRCASAAALPTSGFAPAPSPRVMSRPMSSLTSASDMSSTWASVLSAMNSTPRTPPSTIRLTALTPPPPTPTTLMTARYPPV